MCHVWHGLHADNADAKGVRGMDLVKMDLSKRNRENSTPSENEVQAIARVAADPMMRPHAHVIFADWKRWEDHMEWIATADRADIMAWVEYQGGANG